MINFKKIAKLKIPWFISAVILLSVSLFSAYQVNIKAMGLMVFAGRVSATIPMATCSNQYTCSACSLCGCGAWDQDIIAPIFGKSLNSTYYACKMPSYIPMGQGEFMVGSVILGSCASNQLSAYTPIGCNIWSQWQL